MPSTPFRFSLATNSNWVRTRVHTLKDWDLPADRPAGSLRPVKSQPVGPQRASMRHSPVALMSAAAAAAAAARTRTRAKASVVKRFMIRLSFRTVFVSAGPA